MALSLKYVDAFTDVNILVFTAVTTSPFLLILFFAVVFVFTLFAVLMMGNFPLTSAVTEATVIVFVLAIEGVSVAVDEAQILWHA